MTKHEFLDALEALTKNLPEAERRRLLEYYAELIDDSLEEGRGEEEAVAALGDPAELARELADAPRAEASAEHPSAESVGALRGLRIRTLHADIKVIREPLLDGAAAQLRFSDPKRFSWRMDGDIMDIEEKEPEGARFSLQRVLRQLGSPGHSVTVALSGDLDGDLALSSSGGDMAVDGLSLGGDGRFTSASGDLRAKGLACAGSLEIESRSGDARLDDMSVEGRLRAHTLSGDLSANHLAARGEARLETASGDIELRALDCGPLTLITASGDLELDRGRAGEVSVRTGSGDVRADELEADPALGIETASGDVSLSRCIARDTRIATASGDVSLRLEPLPCGYDLTANSVSGSIHMALEEPAQQGERPRIAVQTVSGDISARTL